MKVIVKAGALAGALDYIAAAIPKKIVIPILGDCRIEAAGGRIALTATDLDLVLAVDVDGQVAEPGIVIAPCTRLRKLFGELPAIADVTLMLDDDRLVVKSGRGRWSLPTLPPGDFPQLDGPSDGAASLTLPKAEARRLVKRVAHAISDEETRYYLNGVHLVRRSDKVTCAATNGHKLVEMVIDADPGSTMPPVIVPRKAVEILAELGGEVQIRLDDRKMELTGGDRRCVSKLIDATFPDYVRVIPAPSDTHVEVASADLLAAVERLKAIASPDDGTPMIGIVWSTDNGLSLCLSREPDAGSEQLDATITGSGRVAMQAGYLTETIKALDAKSVALDHDTDGGPVRFTTGEAGTVALVMPVMWTKPVVVADPPARGKRRRAA